MADKRILKVKAESANEKVLLEMLDKNGIIDVRCQLGEIFGSEYNQYIISEEDYKKIKNKINR